MMQTILQRFITTVTWIGMIAIASLDTCLAAPGDTIHVVTHNNTMVITDPSKGSKSYPVTATFPTSMTDYRKAGLYITYRCPDSLHCGEWDYIDAVYLVRHAADSLLRSRLELARIISPYGWRFDSTWYFTWHTDISDFAPMLHDSVQIEFVHTGYESNTDRGWLVTLDFTMIEGRPPMHQRGMDTLWCGTFPYGDTANPIETLLHPISVQHDSAAIARLRILQTGHGMDDSANCAEFCRKYRRVYFDDSLVNERYIWRECSDNPLYPQAGTWLFDRANWCPGSVVQPDVYDIPIVTGRAHNVNIDMEPYINPNKPSANYHIYSYAFYYDLPWANNDVAIGNILVPSESPEYSRQNPSCAGASFLITNYGRSPVTSMTIRYGATPEMTSTLEWHGEIPSQRSVVVEIPERLIAYLDQPTFIVVLESPNGKFDDYPADNHASSRLPEQTMLPQEFVLLVRTNSQPEQSAYSLVDESGKPVISRASGELQANHTYRDTLTLNMGCYTFTMTDTADDGLEFWFNPEGGYGYIRFLTLDGRMIKSLNADFGREARFCFSVSTEWTQNTPKVEPVVQIFPARNKGKFDIDLFYDTTSTVIVRITNDSTKAVIYDKNYGLLKDSVLPINITEQPDGVYYVHVITGDSTISTISRRFRVKRDE